jgi:V-type H+-transporting ATPase subunit a
MYGDMGHGTAILLYGLYMIINQEKFKAMSKAGTLDGLVGVLFPARYLILLMGFFAFYAGT